MADTLPDVPGLSEMAPSFRRAFVDTARSVGVDVDHLAALISHESRFNPQAVNPGGAVGLLQWLPSTAHKLGTSAQALLQMSATEQLPYVAAYFAPWHGHLAPRDVIIAALGSGVGQPDATVIDTSQWSDAQTKGLDTNHDGVVTLGDVRAQVDNMLASAARRPRLSVPDVADRPSAVDGTERASSGGAVGFFLLVFGGAWALSRRKAGA